MIAQHLSAGLPFTSKVTAPGGDISNTILINSNKSICSSHRIPATTLGVGLHFNWHFLMVFMRMHGKEGSDPITRHSSRTTATLLFT